MLNFQESMELPEAEMSFLLTCKEENHLWIAEQVRYGEGEMLEVREWNGRVHLRHRYSWMNGLENWGEGEKLLVNYLQYELYNEEKGAVTYRNSWITNHVDGEERGGLCPCAVEDRERAQQCVKTPRI
jgi:hypothetical protein